jgi:hypothetical protein
MLSLGHLINMMRHEPCSVGNNVKKILRRTTLLSLLKEQRLCQNRNLRFHWKFEKRPSTAQGILPSEECFLPDLKA